jgi:predicted transcriptional regulator
MEGNKQKYSGIGKSKIQILKYILRQEKPVREAEISEHLKTDFSELSRASVTRHLSDLAVQGCVTKVKPIEKSRLNFWDVEFKNLKNIKKEYPDINLKKIPKTLEILLREMDQEGYVDISNPVERKRFEVQIVLSDAYFTYLINTDIKTFRENVIKLNQFGKDYIKTPMYENLLDEIYIEFIKSISIDYGIGLSKVEFEETLAYLVYTSGSVITTLVQFDANIVKKLWDKLYKKLSEDLDNAAFQQLDFSEIDEKIRLEVCKHASKNNEVLIDSLKQLEMIKSTSTKTTPDVLFKHFTERDILDGKMTEEEFKFVFLTKNIMQKYENDGYQKIAEELDKLYIRFLEDINKH